MGKINNIKIAAVLAAIFFIVGIVTLKDYGINWDTINHLPRGQAYLQYFLTGKKDYSGLQPLFKDWSKPNDWYWQNPRSLSIDTNLTKNNVPTRSMYQLDSVDFNYFMATDGDGHPPLSDIASSVFNRVLFGKLRLINDIDSYHVYGIVLVAMLAALIFIWVSKVYGSVAAFVSVISLGLYPLFFSEAHFNTEKDIPETVFWSFMFFAVWKAITTKSWKWMLAAGVFFGLALGTKFNVLFAIFAIIPWIIFYFIKNNKEIFRLKNISLSISAVFAFFIGMSIFIGTWPYLWPDPLGRIGKVIGFYKGIGIAATPDTRFIGPLGVNTYSIQWIIYATPILILIFAAVGIIAAILRLKKERDLVSILFILWLVIPIARVSWSQANTYGGVRQIMEYIPALAVMSGLGASYILSKLKIKNIKLKVGYVLIALGILLIPILTTHPNENVYFNALIGGLSGAKAKDFPYWGFSFGEAYRQGIEWINDHAERGATVVYTYELIPNIPRLWIRPDLVVNNAARSGYLRRGEYAITLTYQGTNQRSYYDEYLDKFIKPVYEVKVDDVSILKVWKNDDEHMLVHQKEIVAQNIKLTKTDSGIFFDLGGIRSLSRLEITYKDSNICKKLRIGYLEISKDKNTWERLPGILPDDWRISLLGEQPKGGYFIEPFVGQDARFIHLSLEPIDTCLSNITNFKLYYFQSNEK